MKRNNNILVIGLGSMGKRRIRLIKKHFTKWNVFGMDMNEERAKKCAETMEVPVFTSFDEAIKAHEYVCAFVCTSPLSHAAIIKDCLDNNMNIFSEINLVNQGYEENIRIANEKKLLLFLSSTMIYRDEMQYLYQQLGTEKRKMCYTYHVGQYLPDWHPWESYKNFFVGDKRTNGCREIMAIELPWICRVFGKIDDVKVRKSQITNLDIDFPDCYMLLLQHENGTIGTFVVDVVAREPVRDLKIISEDTFIDWGGEPDSFYQKNIDDGVMEQIHLYGKVEYQEGYNKTIVENEYVNEMKQFFDELENGKKSIYNFADDLELLAFIDKVEKEC